MATDAEVILAWDEVCDGADFMESEDSMYERLATKIGMHDPYPAKELLRQAQQRVRLAKDRPKVPDADRVCELLREGRELSKALEERLAPMRVPWDDLERRLAQKEDQVVRMHRALEAISKTLGDALYGPTPDDAPGPIWAMETPESLAELAAQRLRSIDWEGEVG